MAAAPGRLQLRVRGAVQGVGFRPFAFGLAAKFGLKGFVRNDPEGVWIEVEGARASAFVAALRKSPPPLARIDSIDVAAVAPEGGEGFSIAATQAGRAATRIPADAAVCEDCLDELFDPSSRFHLYPLVTCTHCGPRYTLTRALPYDRPQTSMAPFPLCADCARDYRDPSNRRFHAEPVACPNCGPGLSHAIEEIARRVRAGGIVALKGLGGFHLLCDARNEVAVSELRRRKGRDAKPFALMVANVASAERLVSLTAGEREALTHRARPIVLARRRGALAPSVAPGLNDLGVMLAYTPLHWLLLHALAGYPEGKAWRAAASDVALVATSANLGGEPLAADDADARRLAGVADLVVTHARGIVVRADDSVLRIIGGAPVYLRRARGFVPEPIDLGADGPCLIAHGADLKNTVTVTRGREAFVSQHIGDLDDRETLKFRRETIAHLTSILAVKPERVACDLHPDFLSTRSAEAAALPLTAVQHHLAHVAGVIAERGWSGPVLGLALDGQGYGADGAPWGGELLVVDGADWTRAGWLAPLALPGGDRAAREPWRMGVALLHALGRGSEAAARLPEAAEAPRVADALRRGAPAPMTTSLGRWFDAIAALSGIGAQQRYEGQAAMELEARVETPRALAGGWRVEGGVLDLRPFADEMLALGLQGREAAEAFHGTLIAALADWAAQEAGRRGISRIALSGGCFLNRVLSEGLLTEFAARGIEAALPRLHPVNDGGISFGQAAHVFARLTAGKD